MTVPYSGQRRLAIAEEEKAGGPEYEQCLQRLLDLWQQLEVSNRGNRNEFVTGRVVMLKALACGIDVCGGKCPIKPVIFAS